MYPKAALTAAITAVCLGACAGTPPMKAAEPGVASSTIAPLKDFYDVAWVRSTDGAVSSLQQVADELAGYDVVFFGEMHGHPGNHLAQMRLFRALQERNADMTLSLEQFERDTQPLVDQYLAGEIGEKVLEKDARAWPNYKSSYRPLVEYAVDQRLPVIAANAPKSIVICVSKEGTEILDQLPDPDRGWAAETLHVDEGAYLNKYMRFMAASSSHGGGDESEESDEGDESEEVSMEELSPMMRAMVMKSFSAQVTRDDTMAESIAKHLGENPGRKVLHLNGHFHSASHLGTVERLKMHMPELKIAVIQPIAVEDNDVPAWTAKDITTGDFLLLVRDLPEEFVSEERELEFQREVLGKRMGNKCEYVADEAADK